MVHVHIVLLSAVPCKIIGTTNGCCEGRYIKTQTNQKLSAYTVSYYSKLNQCLKVVYIQLNIWQLVKKKMV